MPRLLATLLAALMSSPGAAQTSSQTVTRLRITPAVRAVAVGDSLKLRVEALDARGNVVPGVTVRFTPQGGRFQASIDSSGVIRAGAPGTVPIAILVTSPNSAPYSEKIEVTLLPGPAARLTMSPPV